MDDDKNNFTEAELQIEKLKKLKDQKDTKDKQLKEEVFKYAELPHVVSLSQEKHDAKAEAPPRETTPDAVTTVKEETSGSVKLKKQPRASRIDRKNSDKIKKIVKKIKIANKAVRLSEDMLVNMILSRVMELNIGFSEAQSADDIRAMLQKIKAE